MAQTLAHKTKERMRTILVLGGSCGGAHAAQVLADGLKGLDVNANAEKDRWRVVLVDRNSHANHLYAFCRISVLPGHEHKAFVPYTNVFNLHPPPESGMPEDYPPPCANWPHEFVHAHINELDLARNVVRVKRLHTPPSGCPASASLPLTEDIPFEYLIYALGSHLPAPIDLWGEHQYKHAPTPSTSRASAGVLHGHPHQPQIQLPIPKSKLQKLKTQANGHATSPSQNPTPKAESEEVYYGLKAQAMARMRSDQKRIAAARSILVVGGGALGIQYATDIKEVHPHIRVTLLHSRYRLLPRFDPGMHTQIMETLESAGIETILGERLEAASVEIERRNAMGERVVRTQNGREVVADLVLLCTGQRPNTGLLAAVDPGTVDAKTGMTRVLRTLQIASVRRRQEVENMSPTSTASSESDGVLRSAESLRSYTSASTLNESMPATPSRLPPARRFRMPARCRTARDGRGSLLSRHASDAGDEDEEGEESEEGDEGDAVWVEQEGVDGERVDEALEKMAKLELEEGEREAEGLRVYMQAGDVKKLENGLARAEGANGHEREASGSADEAEEEGEPSWTPYPHVFVIGDAADAFGAIQAGHNAYYQAKVAAGNVLRLIRRERLRERIEHPDACVSDLGREEDGLALEHYTPGPPAIKVSLGVRRSVYQIDGVVGVKDDGVEDLQAPLVWAYYGMKGVREEGMFA